MEERNIFNEKVSQIYSTTRHNNKNFVFTKDKIDRYIHILESKKKTTKEYHINRTYKIRYHKGVKQLVHKKSDSYMIYMEQIFDTIQDAHSGLGHRGEKSTHRKVRETVANVSMQMIKIFIKNCTTCNLKQRLTCIKNIVIKPIVSHHFGERVQVDLISMLKDSCRGYNYILNYQDHATKFCVLRALRTKTSYEVSSSINEIFRLFGPPTIIQTDNGAEFGLSLEELIGRYWPDTKIIRGRPYHPQSQGSVERSNACVVDLLRGVLNDDRFSCQNWVEALSVIQYIKNTSHNRTIGMSPHSTLFGNHIVTNNMEMNAKKMISPLPDPIAMHSKVLIPIPKKYKLKKLSHNNFIGYTKHCDNEGNYTIQTGLGFIIKEKFKVYQLHPVSERTYDNIQSQSKIISFKHAILMDNPPPNHDIVCRCITGCSNGRCPCRRMGALCGDGCSCCSSKCSNNLL